MSTPTPRPEQHPKLDARQIWWAVASAVPLVVATLVLFVAVDTSGAGEDGFGHALVALVTGADSGGARIVSTPALWVCRALVLASVVADAFLIRQIFGLRRAPAE